MKLRKEDLKHIYRIRLEEDTVKIYYTNERVLILNFKNKEEAEARYNEFLVQHKQDSFVEVDNVIKR